MTAELCRGEVSGTSCVQCSLSDLSDCGRNISTVVGHVLPLYCFWHSVWKSCSHKRNTSYSLQTHLESSSLTQSTAISDVDDWDERWRWNINLLGSMNWQGKSIEVWSVQSQIVGQLSRMWLADPLELCMHLHYHNLKGDHSKLYSGMRRDLAPVLNMI